MIEGNTPSATKRRPDWAALAIAVFLFAISGVIFWDASHLSAIAQYDRVGPATVPEFVAFGLANKVGLFN